MAKFYAVRKGKKTGIFHSWEECKEQVSNYSGAIYKSFKTLTEAEEYLNGQLSTEEKEPAMLAENYAFIDGSFDAKNGIYGSGVVIVTNNKKITHKFAGNNSLVAEMHNVAGELEAVKYVMKYCLDNNIKDITIYYDYTGIACWALGEWQAKTKYTAHYAEIAKKVLTLVNITFVKVKAHSGIELNEEVDTLAREAIVEFLKNN